MRVIFLPVLIQAALMYGPAMADCRSVPTDVQEYLRTQSGWSLIDSKDLIDSDKLLWEQHQPGKCPGMATVDLDGTGSNSYALSLFNRAKNQGKLVVIRQLSGKAVPQALVSPHNVLFTTSPAVRVVWRGSPGPYRVWDNSKTITIAHDSIVYEKMEATATAYYWSNGKFHSILISD